MVSLLSTLWQQQFFANKKKCKFERRQIRYLGHLISGLRVEMDRDKVEVMLEWPIPKTIKALRGFLGLICY